MPDAHGSSVAARARAVRVATSDGAPAAAREGRDSGRGGPSQEKTPHLERVVASNRVAKVVKVVDASASPPWWCGDGDGMVGVGYGKGEGVPAPYAKGVEEAKKNFLPRASDRRHHSRHPIQGEAAAGVVLLRPASAGTGVMPVARCVPCWSAPACTTC